MAGALISSIGAEETLADLQQECTDIRRKHAAIARVCDEADKIESEEQRTQFLRQALPVGRACSTANWGKGTGSDDVCRDQTRYGLEVRTGQQMPGELAELIRGNETLAKGADADAQAFCHRQNLPQEQLARCLTMEMYFSNVGMSEAASSMAIVQGYGAIGDLEKAKAIIQGPMRRQIECAAEQSGSFQGKCARTASAEAIRAIPANGNARQHFNEEYFGVLESERNQAALDMYQVINSTFNNCAKQGTDAAQCQVDPEELATFSLMDSGGALKEDVKGNILLPSDWFLEAMKKITEKVKLDSANDRREFARQVNQTTAGDIIPRMIEEEKAGKIYGLVDDKIKLDLCKKMGEQGLKPPSTDDKCMDEFKKAYSAKFNKPTDDDEFRQITEQGERRKLDSSEDMGIAELADAKAAFAALREVALIEARNNPDLFQKAQVFSSNGASNAQALAQAGERAFGKDPAVERFAGTAGSGTGPGMLAAGVDVDGDTSEGALSSNGAAAIPPRQANDVVPVTDPDFREPQAIADRRKFGTFSSARRPLTGNVLEYLQECRSLPVQQRTMECEDNIILWEDDLTEFHDGTSFRLVDLSVPKVGALPGESWTVRPLSQREPR